MPSISNQWFDGERGGALIDIDHDARQAGLSPTISDAGLSWDEYKTRQTALTENARARCVAKDTRGKAVTVESFNADLYVMCLGPLITRWCYYTGIRPVWNEPCPVLWEQFFEGNAFLMTRPSGVASPEGVPFFH